MLPGDHIPKGWICPRCNKVWAPHIDSCDCNKGGAPVIPEHPGYSPNGKFKLPVFGTPDYPWNQPIFFTVSETPHTPGRFTSSKSN